MGEANSKPTSNTKPTYADKVSEKIIEAIEAGTAPWMKPWAGAELLGMMPQNATTGKAYNGINAIHLMTQAVGQGYGDPRWVTYKQADELGANVKKGEKSTLIQYWKMTDFIDVLDADGNPKLKENGQPQKQQIKLENPKVFYASVFNAEQCENMPKLDIKPMEWDANERAETILENSGAKIQHIAGDRAFYSSSQDAITLPLKEQFTTQESYYATALHELGHWTGHETRLDRKLGNEFGSVDYAKEELRAEIASFMLSARIGIDFDPSQHYSYIGSWAEVLQEDNKEIFRAARDAEKITDFVEGLSMEKVQTQTEQKALDIDVILADKETTQLEKQTYLFVPYSEKDDAKKAGAKYDVENKMWYAPKGTPTQGVEKWRVENVHIENLNLAQSGDYKQDFKTELQARGFEVDNLQDDGRIRNVKVEGNKGGEKSGSYAIHTDGRPTLWYRNYKTGEEGSITHKSSNFEAGASKEELKKYEELNRIKGVQRDKDTERMHFAVSSRLEKEFESLKDAPVTHPYLEKKGIEAHGAKIDDNGNLVIAYKNTDGKIQTAQKIDDNGNKLFEKGGAKNGNFATIGEKLGNTVIIAEGFATGASIHEATKIQVLVAGDAGNIKHVLDEIIKANPNQKVIIAADNDLQNQNGNIGLNKANEAIDAIAKKYGNSDNLSVITPQFTKEEQAQKLTDFNDLAKSRGIQSVKEQIETSVLARHKIMQQARADEQKMVQTQVVKSQNEQMSKTPTRQHEMSK